MGVFFCYCNDRGGLVLKKDMEILLLPVLSPVCKRSVNFMIWSRILWAVVFDGKKNCIFFLLLVEIDNANLQFKFLRKMPVSKINVHCAKIHLVL